MGMGEEYGEKMGKGEWEGERVSLEKEGDGGVEKVEMEWVREKIEWGGGLGDLRGLVGEEMKNVVGEVKEYVKRDELKK